MSHNVDNVNGVGSARLDWSRATRATKYVKGVLGQPLRGSGLVRKPMKRGWLRRRLREFLEGFPTPVAAQEWVEAAVFKAKLATDPMAYFVRLIGTESVPAASRELRRLLSREQYEAWTRSRQPRAGSGGRS